MHGHLRIVTQSALLAFSIVTYTVGYLLHGFLHLIHADILVEVTQYFFQRTLSGHISTDILFLNPAGTHATIDERGEHILGHLDRLMGKTESFVLDFQPITEITLHLIFCLGTKQVESIFAVERHLAYLVELLPAWCGQSENIFETIGHSRIVDEEIIKAFGQT